jgi:hypothetical protein
MARLLRRGDVVMTAALLVVFAIMVGEASGYPRDSRLFPVLVGTIGLAVAALLLFRILRGQVPPGGEADEGAPDAAPLAAALLAPPLFGVGIWLIGFWASTALVAFFGPAFMGYRSIWRRALLAAGTVAMLAVLFPVVLDLPLPQGLAIDYLFPIPDDED